MLSLPPAAVPFSSSKLSADLAALSEMAPMLDTICRADAEDRVAGADWLSILGRGFLPFARLASDYGRRGRVGAHEARLRRHVRSRHVCEREPVRAVGLKRAKKVVLAAHDGRGV